MLFNKDNRVLNLSEKELSEMATKSDNKTKELKRRMSEISTDIGQLSRERDTVEEGLKREEKRVVAIREAVILNEGIPRKVSVVRDTLLKIINRSTRDDITIGRKIMLDKQIKDLKEEIKAVCNHPFVFHREGCFGTRSFDYEDGYPSERYCVVCGLEERAKDFRQKQTIRVGNVGSVFEVLNNSEDRVVHGEPYRPYPNNFSKLEIWVPLGVALKPFEESVAKALNS